MKKLFCENCDGGESIREFCPEGPQGHNLQFSCEECGEKVFLRNAFAVLNNKFGKCPTIGSVFHGYYDRGFKGGREITSKRQIREIEKMENKVYGGYEELNQEADKNREYNEKAIFKDFQKSTEEKLFRALKR